jgi:hypothetical protein
MDWSMFARPTPKWYLDAKFGIFIHWGAPVELSRNGDQVRLESSGFEASSPAVIEFQLA